MDNKFTRPSDQVIKNQRLQKKIDRLIHQRDFYKEKFEHYKAVIAEQPYIESRSQRYTELKQEYNRIKNLERRCTEQALLIKLLAGERVDKAELESVYRNILKEEYLKLNSVK